MDDRWFRLGDHGRYPAQEHYGETILSFLNSNSSAPAYTELRSYRANSRTSYCSRANFRFVNNEFGSLFRGFVHQCL